MAASVCASEDELERDRITAIVRVAAAEAEFQDLKPEQMQAILEFIESTVVISSRRFLLARVNLLFTDCCPCDRARPENTSATVCSSLQK